MNPFAQVGDISLWLRSNGLEIVLWALGAVILGRFVYYIGRRVTTRIDASFQGSDALVRTETAKHRHALAQVITWVIQIAVYVLIGFQILELLGVRTAGLAIPASVLAAAVGFGAQRIVQDILAGFFIITERQYGYGDVVRISVTGAAALAEGAVEDVTLRITRIRSADGEVITVPNGQIVKVDNLSKDWARAVVDVPIAAGADISRVNQILHDVGAAAIEDNHLAPLLLDEPTVMGVESLEVDQVNMRLVARTLPGKQFEVGRILRERVVSALAREGLGVAAAGVNETTRGGRRRARTDRAGRRGPMSPVLGRARRIVAWWRGLGIRNSTVLLCVAWLAVFVLYIYVRPEPQPTSGETSVPVVTTPRYAPTYEESTLVTTTPTSPTVTGSVEVDGTETTVAPTTTTGLLDNLVPPFLRPETTSSAPN